MFILQAICNALLNFVKGTAEKLALWKVHQGSCEGQSAFGQNYISKYPVGACSQSVKVQWHMLVILCHVSMHDKNQRIPMVKLVE